MRCPCKWLNKNEIVSEFSIKNHITVHLLPIYRINKKGENEVVAWTKKDWWKWNVKPEHSAGTVTFSSFFYSPYFVQILGSCLRHPPFIPVHC